MSMQQTGQISSLTALRFFAAALVVVFHFARPNNVMLETFIGHGAYGVTIFFVLSGFILAYSYSLGPGILRANLRAFWVARLARLYPVYLLGILLFAPILLRATNVPAWQRAVAGLLSLTVAQAWFHLLGTSWGMWNPPGWSLSAEAFFYLLFPLFCLPLSRLPVRRLMLVACACWVLSVLGMFTHALADGGGDDFWAFVPLIRLPDFVLGLATGLAWKQRRTRAFDGVAPVAGVAATAAMFTAMWLPVDAAWFFSGALAPLAALLICSLACNRGLLARCMSWPPLVTLGCASYALYILHWPMWLIGKHFFGQSRLASQQPNVYFIVYFVVTTVAAYLCYRFFEEPMNRLLRRKLMPAGARDRQAGIGAAHLDELADALPGVRRQGQ
jgi:peptidoglycan/LPS O-acetylase OafA/YrhL